MSADALCSGKSIKPVPSSIAVEPLVRLGGEQLMNAERILGEAKLKAVDPALIGMPAISGQVQYLVRAAAFARASNYFKGRMLDHTLYVSAHILGHVREVEPAVVTLSSPISLDAVECAYFATE
ncbi:hypothetical protein [Janthinobacterium sp. HH01]|uniref:hypothetical protein n=1 Tax=Janthinobacterium sp. HH01 TaxID=1198452 RepID=UPI00126854E0|nr:hypothetical protein [Janthinobacterium sp. HH01]